jgi:hypothetical protein
MADFRKKLFGLAGALTMFSGMAFGQLCNGAGNNTLSLTLPVTALNIRAEGQTELLPALTLTCQATGAGTSTFNVLVQIPGVTVTSKVLSSSTGLTEANITGGGAGGTVTGPGTPTSPTFGTISSGNVITFTGLSITTTGAGPVTMTISDIRINASALPGGGAFPTAVTANSFVQGTTFTTSGTSSGSGLNVAFVFNALATTNTKVSTAIGAGNTTSGATYAVCNGVNSGSSGGAVSFYIAVTEGFASAFKKQADETGPSPVTLGTTTNAATSGTRIKFIFNNVPTGLNIYMPLVVTASSGTDQISATTSETGTFAAPTAATSPGAIGGLTTTNSSGGFYQVPVSGTTATAIYEVTTDALTVINTFYVPFAVSAAANAVTSFQTNPTMTVTTVLAPQTAATQIPSFSSTPTDTVTANTFTFAACTTNLLFPFVTNANGFETGIAIANTSKDPFKSATPQSGTCTLNFYMSGVSGSTNPTAVTAPNLTEGANQPFLAGETYAFTLTQALGVNTSNPATFQGYVIAQCGFSYGHGFAYILGGLQPGMFVNPTNTAMGYLALVLSRGTVGGITDPVTF